MTRENDDRLFDTGAMWRLFNDVQRLGFETAASVAKRFSRLVEEDLGAGPRRADGARSARAGSGGGLGPETEEQWVATVRSAWEVYGDLVQASWEAFGTAVDLSLEFARPWMTGFGERLHLRTTRGEKVSATFYVHNTSSQPAQAVKVSADGLIGPGATVLKPVLSLDEVEKLEPGGRFEVGVEVEPPRDAPLGRYLGQIRAATDPPSVIEVALDVVEPDRV